MKVKNTSNSVVHQLGCITNVFPNRKERRINEAWKSEDIYFIVDDIRLATFPDSTKTREKKNHNKIFGVLEALAMVNFSLFYIYVWVLNFDDTKIQFNDRMVKYTVQIILYVT